MTPRTIDGALTLEGINVETHVRPFQASNTELVLYQACLCSIRREDFEVFFLLLEQTCELDDSLGLLPVLVIRSVSMLFPRQKIDVPSNFSLA